MLADVKKKMILNFFNSQSCDPWALHSYYDKMWNYYKGIFSEDLENIYPCSEDLENIYPCLKCNGSWKLS